MSITIQPESNSQYVDQHCPEKIEIELLNEDGNYGMDPYEVKYYPYEINMSNTNFFEVFSALGIEVDYCGNIHPNLLLAAIKKSSAKSLTKDTSIDQESGKCKIITVGRNIDYVSRRLFELRALANEALRRGVDLTWC